MDFNHGFSIFTLGSPFNSSSLFGSLSGRSMDRALREMFCAEILPVTDLFSTSNSLTSFNPESADQ